ncbi:MAG TPA: hypothetical protein VKB96_16590 [Gammaproteobacteria bacterium]|nr:hypothetical protein [Gammaproteobacteria bacterium]
MDDAKFLIHEFKHGNVEVNVTVIPYHLTQVINILRTSASLEGSSFDDSISHPIGNDLLVPSIVISLGALYFRARAFA